MNIGILASGGDGAGMNYCLFNLYKNLYKNHNVYLFNRGYYGLMNKDILYYDYDVLNKYKNDGGISPKRSRSSSLTSSASWNVRISAILR